MPTQRTSTRDSECNGEVDSVRGCRTETQTWGSFSSSSLQPTYLIEKQRRVGCTWNASVTTCVFVCEQVVIHKISAETVHGSDNGKPLSAFAQWKCARAQHKGTDARAHARACPHAHTHTQPLASLSKVDTQVFLSIFSICAPLSRLLEVQASDDTQDGSLVSGIRSSVQNQPRFQFHFHCEETSVGDFFFFFF